MSWQSGEPWSQEEEEEEDEDEQLKEYSTFGDHIMVLIDARESMFKVDASGRVSPLSLLPARRSLVPAVIMCVKRHALMSSKP
jgi:hypothetical protein